MKKQKCKRLLSCVLALVMLLGMVPMNTSAATTGTTEDGLAYEISDGKVTITDYYGSADYLTIPSEIEGYPVKSIGDSAFYYCGSFMGVTIPESVISIGDNAFNTCNLESVTIPAGVTSIGAGVFGDCDSLVDITVDENNTVYDSRNDCNAIIETATNILIQGCGDTVIPDSITGIGDYAFFGFDSLEDVIIPDDVTSIGDYAFYDCFNLFSVELPDGLAQIGDYAFSGCNNLRNFELPESVTSLGEYWLSGCESLEFIRIPGGITSVEPYTFSGFGGDIEFSYGVTNIESYAFFDYGTYDSFYETWSAIYFPYTLTSIEDFGFSGCRAERIELPTCVESIGDLAFEGCSNLKEMVISGSVKSIGDAAFVDCDSLETVMILKGTYSDQIVSLGQEMFVRCYSLKSVIFPDGITSIGLLMFYSCENLETIITDDMCEAWMNGLETVNTLPDSVTSIEDNAFYNCAALNELTVPAGVTSIGEGAFDGCDSLTDVYYKGTQKQWEQIEIGEYNECLTDATIHYSEPVAEVTGNSITLSGDIGVNFFMNVKDDVLSDENATVVFTYDDNVIEIPVGEGTKTENGYKYTCNIPAKDMTTEVTCKVVSSSSESEEFVYSIKEYAEVILANPDTYGEEAVKLVKSMLNYGAAAQTYFGYKTGSLANDTEYMTDEDRVVATKDFSNLSYSLTEGEGEVKYYGTALSLKSEVGIKHYFIVDETVDVDTLTVAVNGEPAELVQNGDFYELTIPDIAAHNLYTDYVVQVGNVSLSYCAMDYAATAQKIYGAGGLLRLMYALDAYAQNAIAYAN